MKFEAGKPVRTRLIALVWRRWQASESRQEEWKGRGMWGSGSQSCQGRGWGSTLYHRGCDCAAEMPFSKGGRVRPS